MKIQMVKKHGHLGTEIINKASTVLQVGYVKAADQSDTDLIKVSYLHCRSTKKHEPFYIKYSEEEKGLVLAEQRFITETLDKRNLKASIKEVADFLGNRLLEPVKKQTLIDELKVKLDCTARTIEDRLKELIDSKYSIEVNENEYFLTKDKTGRNTIYKLELSKTSIQEIFKYDSERNSNDNV
jgi:hypothetical protein